LQEGARPAYYVIEGAELYKMKNIQPVAPEDLSASGRWYWGIERGKKLLLCREMPFSFIFHWYHNDEKLLEYL